MPDPNQQTMDQQNPTAQVPPPQAQVPPSTPVAPPQPPTPATPPTPTAPSAANQPAAASPTTPATPAPPKTKQEWFQHLIKMSTPPQNVVTTDPTTGAQTVANKATPMSLAQLVITSALAGSFGTKDTYRQGSYGPILDRQASNADAFNKGQQIGKDYSQAAQKQQDDLQSRKLSVVAANIQAAHNYAAMTQAQFAAQKAGAEAETAQDAVLEKTAAQNQSTTLASADDYDHGLTDKNAPKARLAQGMTWDELMASPFKGKMTSQLMIQDGTRQVYDEHLGRTKLVPTYSVLNPDVKIKLNEDTVARMEKINPSFGNDLYKVSGGNVQLPLTQLVTLNHQATSVMHAEATLQSLADSTDALAKNLGITGDVEGKLAAAARGNKSVWKSLSEFENGQAHGGSTADQLQRILQSDGGDAIFKALGTDRDRVQDYIESYNNRIASARKLASEGGMGEKAPMAQPQVNSMIQAIDSNGDLTSDDKKLIHAQIPPPDKDGVVRMNQGQGAKVDAMAREMITTDKNNSEKSKLANGDPAQVQQTAQNVLGYGSVDQVTKLASMRGNARSNAQDGLEKTAADKGLNPAHFSQSMMDTKADTVKSYGAAGKIGQSLNSFRTFTQHLDNAADANDAWTRANSPLLDKPISWIAKNATNDQNYQRFRDSLLAPAKEYMSFLNANRAEHEADIRDMQGILDENATPRSIYTALQTFAKTADERLLALGQGYLDTVGTTAPNLISKTSVDNMKRVGVNSKAQVLSGDLPRAQSWVTNLQFQTLNPQNPQDKAIAQRFVQVGGDPTKAMQIAREHGFILNLQ